MPDIQVRNKKTGKIDTIKWNKGRAPRPDEINAILAQQEGKPLKTGFNGADEWDDTPVRQSSAPVYMPEGKMPDIPAPPPSTFSRVLDTAYGGENSYLPPIRGITRPALPDSSQADWGPEEDRWKLARVPYTYIPHIPAISKWGYENITRPASSVVGTATDLLTAKVTGPLLKGAGRWLRGGKEVAEEVAPLINPKAPSYSPVQKLLPQRAASAQGHFVVDEAGVATHSQRPYTPLERKPFDPRSVRGPSGTVSPTTGRVVPAREAGRFVARTPEPVPTIGSREIPVVDIPADVSAAYPAPRVPPTMDLPPVEGAGIGPNYTGARRAAERQVIDWNARTGVYSPVDPRVRGGAVVAEEVGEPLARRIGESREAFRARVAAANAPYPPAISPSEIITPDVPAPSSAIPTRTPPLGRKVGSGKSVGAAEALPESTGIFSRLRNTLADETGSVPRRKRTDLRTAAQRRRTMQELAERDREGKITPEDVKTASKLKFPESWKQFLPESLRNEKGSVNFSAIVNKMTDRQKAKAAKEVGPDWVEKLEAWWNKTPDVSAPGSSAKPLKVGLGQSKGTVEKPITREAPNPFTPGGRKRIKEEAMDIANVPRAMMSTLDLSGFRQAAGSLHKKELWQNVNNMRKAVGSEKFFKELQASIASHPKYVRASKAQLALSDLPKPGGKLKDTEELFMSRFAEKIPGYGKLVRASGRGYVGLLNKTRMDLFNNLTEEAVKSGAKTSDAEIAKLVNAMTGRGNLPKVLEDSVPLLNSIFFSPRLAASRLHMLNPVNYIKASPLVRKEMAKSIGTVAAKWWGMSELLEVASGGKYKVEKDPRSSDFGKVRIGNIRLDFGSGFQQYIRLAAQTAPLLIGQRGKFKDTETGAITEYGKGYRSTTELGNVANFLKGKLAPVPSAIATHMENKVFSGEKPQWLPDVKKIASQKTAGKMASETAEQLLSKSEISKKFNAMFLQDIYSIQKENPELAAAMAPFLFFGESANVQKRRTARQKYQ
jgi:hypothetical protein